MWKSVNTYKVYFVHKCTSLFNEFQQLKNILTDSQDSFSFSTTLHSNHLFFIFFNTEQYINT